MRKPLTIDFFHDVVCAWSFNMSSRLRVLAEEFDLDIQHKAFVLQASKAEMRARWGSLEGAKEIILGHWENCRRASDQPELINIEAMRKAPFNYPHGYTAALACKAAEHLGGQAGHWAMFDRLQRAHLSEARDISDPATACDAAVDLGYEAGVFAAALTNPRTAKAVKADRREAEQSNVYAVPTVRIRQTGACLVNAPMDDLRWQIQHLLARMS